MTDVIITGTGVPHLSPGRAGPGVLVRAGDTLLQFDAGRATALRLVEAGVRVGDLSALFVTHHHSDHLTGLQDLLFARWLEGQTDFVPLEVVAPVGPSTDYLHAMMEPWAADIAVRQSHVGRTDRPDPVVSGFAVGPGAEVVWQRGDVRVLAAAVHHEPVLPAVAYRVETGDGVVVISGDTAVCDEVAALAADADVLVHEAFRRDLMMRFVDDFPHVGHIADYHADTKALGVMAAGIDVPTLLLTHLIPPPRDEAGEAQLAEEVRAGGYAGEIVVARDLTEVSF